ncbi:MAG TPA: protein kinase [Gemmatimonadaceae bacterium]|nr:protein kinase [Gemmatimonadaceae bacterium]
MPEDLQRQLQEVLGDAYRLTGELGGGMARVFVADERATGETVVVKVLAPELARGVDLERFRREIQVAERLDHPRIVPVRAVGQGERLMWYAMPYVGDDTLRNLLAREGALPLDRALAIAADVADALGYAHGRNIVHRDIKPENILIDAAGRAMVTDFGIARAIEKSADIVSITSTGLTLGTPAYMSPEQAAGNMQVDGRSDVYSLACVVYEMLSGEPPFTGPTAQAIIARHLNEAPRSLRVIRPSVSPALQAVVEKALAKNAADRYADAGAFVTALMAPEHTTVGRQAVRARRPGVIAAVLGVTAIAVVLAVPPVRRWMTGQRASAPALDPRRIAVLDFEDQTADRSLGYIASGLASSLVDELGRASAIQVISRNAMHALLARGVPADSVAMRLAAGSLVEGGVQRAGDRIRVTLRLVDPVTHTQLETASFDRPMAQLFLLEDDLAHQAASLLRRRIGRTVQVGEAAAGTRNAVARDLAFRADKEVDDAVNASRGAERLPPEVTTRKLEVADSLLAGAEHADAGWIAPVIKRSTVALALAQGAQGGAQVRLLGTSLSHAQRALDRSPRDPRALEARGTVRYWTASWLALPDTQFASLLTGAEADLTAAVAADSTSATAWGTLALVKLARGDTPAAQRYATRAFALDTYLANAPDLLAALWGASLVKGDYDDSWRWCEQAAADYPEDSRFIQCRLGLMAEDGARPADPALARTLVARAERLDPSGARAPHSYVPLYRQLMAGAVFARAGERDSAEAVIRRVRRATGGATDLLTDMLYDEAYIRLLLGERAAALRLLDRYLTAHPTLRALAAGHARWHALAGDTTFARMTAAGR